MHHAPTTPSARQRGAALITGIIFLFVMTLLGVAAMQTTTMQQHLSTGYEDHNRAFQVAEATLRKGEREGSSVRTSMDWTDYPELRERFRAHTGFELERTPQYKVRAVERAPLEADGAVEVTFEVGARAWGVRRTGRDEDDPVVEVWSKFR